MRSSDKRIKLCLVSRSVERLEKGSRIERQERVDVNVQIVRLCLLRASLHAASPQGQTEARYQYQEAVKIVSKLKASNEIALAG